MVITLYVHNKEFSEQRINWVKPKKPPTRFWSQGPGNLREPLMTAFHFVVFQLHLKLQLRTAWKLEQEMEKLRITTTIFLQLILLRSFINNQENQDRI